MGRQQNRRRKKLPHRSPRSMPHKSPRPMPPDEPRLQPEIESGNVEYKSRLINPTPARLEHLSTQMKWRLHEGHGECFYLLGVEDDGTMSGLTDAEMSETLGCVKQMAETIGATLLVVNDRCVRGNKRVVEVLVRSLPSEQPSNNLRIGILGSAAAGKSTLAGCLTHGTLDDGAGAARLNMLRHLHEIRSGKTTTVTQDVFGFKKGGKVVNYKDHDLTEVLESSSKLVTLIDLAGDHKYLRSTIYGISSHTPHYCALLINGRIGWNTMSQEHWDLANVFKIPTFFVLTKTDLISTNRIAQVVDQIRTKCGMDVRLVENKEDAQRCAELMVGSQIVPILAVSTVSGANLNHLLSFLHSLPVPTIPMVTKHRSDSRSLLFVHQVFRMETGTVVCGLVAAGCFEEGDRVQVGPDRAGEFRMAKISSLHKNKQPVRSVRANEVGSLALEFASDLDSYAVRKGMVVLQARDAAVCCRRFVAKFRLLSHTADDLCVGFQGTAYIGSLRRTVILVDFDPVSIRPGDECDVTFEFYGGPEFVSVGSKLFFRERTTKGLGEIIRIPSA